MSTYRPRVDLLLHGAERVHVKQVVLAVVVLVPLENRHPRDELLGQFLQKYMKHQYIEYVTISFSTDFDMKILFLT